MLQIMLRGEVINRANREVKKGEDPTSIVVIKTRVYRDGTAQVQDVICVFDAYQTKRLASLKDAPKWLTVRGSDIMPAYETGNDGVTRAFLWCKAEEFFL